VVCHDWFTTVINDGSKKSFLEDPYLTELSTIVTTISGDVVTLQDTIAYAFLSSQQSDEGTINDSRILNAQKDGKEIFYTIEVGHNLTVGDPVLVKID
jgi:Ser-tRNA(Ala) deacylase AlaX